MITNANFVQKSETYHDTILHIEVDMMCHTFTAYISIFKNHIDAKDKIDIANDAFGILSACNGNMTPTMLNELRSCKGVVGYLSLEYLNEISAMCRKAGDDFRNLKKAMSCK